MTVKANAAIASEWAAYVLCLGTVAWFALRF